MRILEIINEYGQSYRLDDLDTGFLKALSGVGFEMDYAYERIGSAWARSRMRTKQVALTGTIFTASPDPYLSERELLAFIRSARDVKIRYTTSAGVWLKDVDIVSYKKGEIKKGALQVPITFMPRSLWYTETANIVVITAFDGNPLRYPYRLTARFSDYSSGSIDAVNDGSTEAAIEVIFDGPISNPVITLSGDTGVIGVVEIPGEADTGERIIYSSRDGRLCCYVGSAAEIEAFRQTGNPAGLTNLALGLSLANANWLKLPQGTSRLTFTADSIISNPISAQIFNFYKAV